MIPPIIVNDAITIPSYELAWSATRSGGPGGQNVNKVSSKVELRYFLKESRALSDAVKSRLRHIARTYLLDDGSLLFVNQTTRDQRQNLTKACDRLRELVAEALVPPKKRFATKPTRGSKIRRLTEKRHHADKKAARGVRDD